MDTERLYLHRVELVSKDGVTKFEPLPESPSTENFGIKYRLAIVKRGDTRADCYGWDTGYRGCGFNEVPFVEAEIYSPQGFTRGKLAFVTAKDKILGVVSRDMASLDGFLEGLNRVSFEVAVQQMQGFSFAGLIQ